MRGLQKLNIQLLQSAKFCHKDISDLQSIVNAINLHWSNGPVEGNGNKLKLSKVKCTEGQASIYSGKDWC
ncbi:hypothetical protein DRW42_27930 [Pedobacter miscanthi]|uniref:Uncharacterized protein n=1 Tax=Pedobacter miscanthi TaxID=2259170 RepID=A0A366KL36_9SPHI|nr:hypothetical protein DRW42_27930 [Pedobacter miscanthi]